MILHLDEVLDFITANNLSFTEGLVKLTSHEIDFKEANMIRSMVNLRQVPIRHNRSGVFTEIKGRFVFPTMCRLTLSNL